MIPKHILLSTDGSEYNRGAMEAAFFFAKTFKAQLHTVFVVDWGKLEGQLLVDLVASSGFEPFGNFFNQYKEQLRLLGHHIMDYVAQRASQEGIPLTSHIEEGFVASTLAKKADTMDLVVAGIRGTHGEKHPDRMGHITHELIHKIKAPLLLVPESFQAPQEMIAGFDGTPTTYTILEHGIEWSKALHCNYVIVHVNNDVREGERILQAMEDYLKPYEAPYQTKLLIGKEKQELLGLIDLETNPILLLGRHSHSPFKEWFKGTLIDYVAHRAFVPLLCI